MAEEMDRIPQTPSPAKSKDKKRIANAAYVVLIVILLALAAGGVYARYVYSNAGSDTVTAREFYFTSDYLTEKGTSYTLNPGTTSICFDLRNYADELRYSPDTISYAVTVAKADGSEISLESGTGTLEKNKKSKATITLSNLVGGETYTVTAVGNGGYTGVDGNYKTDGDGGYSKALTATFTVLSAGTKVYKHLDTSNPAYVVLTVWTENVKGDAKINFPAGLIPDSTDPVLATVTNYSNTNSNSSYGVGNFTDKTSFAKPYSYSSRTYRFFKEDPTASFNVKDFTVTVNETKADPATP